MFPNFSNNIINKRKNIRYYNKLYNSFDKYIYCKFALVKNYVYWLVQFDYLQYFWVLEKRNLVVKVTRCVSDQFFKNRSAVCSRTRSEN